MRKLNWYYFRGALFLLTVFFVIQYGFACGKDSIPSGVKLNFSDTSLYHRLRSFLDALTATTNVFTTALLLNYIKVWGKELRAFNALPEERNSGDDLEAIIKQVSEKHSLGSQSQQILKYFATGVLGYKVKGSDELVASVDGTTAIQIGVLGRLKEFFVVAIE